MLLKTAYRNAGAYSDLVKDANFLGIKLDHEFNRPARAIITLKDEDGSIAQKYGNVQKIAVDAAIEDDGGVQTDETTEANSAAANDMTLTPAAGLWSINDAYYFGFPEKVNGFILNVGTPLVPAAADPVTVWEYWDGDSWETLADISDGSNMYKNSGEVAITWTIPGDWATTTVNSQGPFYYVRQRVTTAADVNQQGLGTQAWYDTIYVGSGYVSYENPDSTSKFEGRIIKAMPDMPSNRIHLLCKDWMSQLEEPRLHYDMREDLDGAGLRQSELASDLSLAEGTSWATFTTGATYYLYDADMAWTPDEWNGMFVVFSNAIAGKITVLCGPNSDTFSNTDGGSFGSWSDAWDIDASWAENIFSGGVWLWHWYLSAIIEEGTLIQSIDGVNIKIYAFANGGDVTVSFVDQTAGSVNIGTLPDMGTDDEFRQYTFRIPETHIGDICKPGVPNKGLAQVSFTCPSGTKVGVDQILMEIDATTSGTSAVYTISDGTAKRLTVDADLWIDGLGLWEGAEYCIAQPIYTHLPGLITDHDDLVTLTTSIESTSGISTRHFVLFSPLEIMQAVRVPDKAVFWMPLGTKQVTYKSTFNDGVPAAITDADVISWSKSEWSWDPVTNEWHITGMRIGDSEIYVDSSTLSPDPGVDSKALYGITRAKALANTGLMSEYDAEIVAGAMVEKDEDVKLFLACDIPGFSTHELGHEVSITSTYLGLTAEVYVVTHFSYDSFAYRTTLRLQPRVSQLGFVDHKQFGENIRQVTESTERLEREVASPEISTQRWT